MNFPSNDPTPSQLTPSAPPFEYYGRPVFMVQKADVPVPPPREESAAPPLPPHSIRAAESQKPGLSTSPTPTSAPKQFRNYIKIFAQTRIFVVKEGPSSQRTTPSRCPNQPNRTNVQREGPPTEQEQREIIRQSQSGLGKCCCIMIFFFLFVIVASIIAVICSQ